MAVPTGARNKTATNQSAVTVPIETSNETAEDESAVAAVGNDGEMDDKKNENEYIAMEVAENTFGAVEGESKKQEDGTGQKNQTSVPIDEEANTQVEKQPQG